jgi:YebC/PmpR family DNA-binding regulatory protein
VTYEEVSYEGYGPAGVAIFMECLTDNKQRTVAEIRHLISKYGGNLGENGSVSWMFDKKGQITLKANEHEEDVVFEAALEAGAEDFEATDNVFIVSTDSSEIMSVRDALDSQGYEIESANIDMVPKNLHNVESDKEQSVITLLEALEDHDDIKAVYTNFDSVE